MHRLTLPHLLVPFVTFVLLLAACGGEAPAKLNTGDRAPGFQATQLDGSSVAFPAAYAGQPLVVRFWADWCKFCEGEMKAIDAVWRRHRDKGLQVVAINAGQDKATVAAFTRKIGVGYTILLDEPAKIARAYGVVGLPTTYFVDGQGIVRGKVIGEADEATFERHALALLK